ncbi:MAG TPA: SBBP repeat-containing protein [Phycisphaerae bacterium]|nr:SBBP repeat-containing protein [Phycisphaerae bacterium]
MTSKCITFALLIAASVSLPNATAADTQPAAAGRYRIAYATFIGGSQWDQLREIIRLPEGSVLVGGQTCSPDLPVTQGVVQPTYAGEPAGTGHPGVSSGDCFVARLDPQGRHFQFVTYFGGSKQERAVYGMALDKKGNIIIATACRSHDLPTTDRAYQRQYGGGEADVILAKLAPDAKSTVWCTYVGGRGNDWPRGGIALDPDDNIVIVGRSDSPDFPGSDGVVRARVGGAEGDAMIVKVRADGTGLVWATLLGGSNWDGLLGARVDAAGNVYVAGHTRSTDLPVTPGAAQPAAGGESDCFLASLSPDGRRLGYCTYLAGSSNEFAEHRPALLEDGSVLLTGATGSADFPATDNAYQKQLKGKTDGFLAKLSPDGTKLTFCTLLGGSGGEYFLMPTADADGNICIVGQTDSHDFPVTPDALQKTYGGGKSDAILAIFSSDGSKLLYATYLGGSGDDLIRSVTLGENGTLYLAGNSNSDDFPVSAHAAQRTRNGNHDGVIMKLEPTR